MSAIMTTSDRRSDPRVAYATRVDLVLGSRSGERGLTCTDLSAGGMALEGRRPPRLGSTVHFGARLDGRREPYRGRGEVVWVRALRTPAEIRYSLAIRFTELDADCSAAVRAAVDQQLAETTAQLFPRPQAAPRPAH